MESDRVVTELVTSYILNAKGRVRRIRVDIDTLKELLAEGHKMAPPGKDYEILLNGIPVSIDQTLKYREMVLESVPKMGEISEEMREWIRQNEK